MNSLTDLAILHIVLSTLCFVCLWAIYKHNPSSRAERSETPEYRTDKTMYVLSLMLPYLTLPIIVMHFRIELTDFIKGKKWDERR